MGLPVNPPRCGENRILVLRARRFSALLGGPFLRACFSYVLRTKKGPLLCHTCTWFVTRKAPCYLAVTWERRWTKIVKGLCGVIGWFQVAATLSYLYNSIIAARVPNNLKTGNRMGEAFETRTSKNFINRLRTSKRIGNSSRKQTSKTQKTLNVSEPARQHSYQLLQV